MVFLPRNIALAHSTRVCLAPPFFSPDPSLHPEFELCRNATILFAFLESYAEFLA